jgi:hypothetical protein
MPLFRTKAICTWRSWRTGITGSAGLAAVLYLAVIGLALRFAAPELYQLVQTSGALGLSVAFLGVHLLWIASSLVAGLSPRLLDARPVAHLPLSLPTIVVVDLLLVLIAPVGPIALIALGSATAALLDRGPSVLMVAGLSALLLAIITALVAQLMARFVHRIRQVRGTWAMVALAAAGLVLLLQGATGAFLGVSGNRGLRALFWIEKLAQSFPSTALPLAAVRAALAGDVIFAVLALIGSLAVVVLAYLVCIRFARMDLMAERGRTVPRSQRRDLWSFLDLGGASGRLLALIRRELKLMGRNALLLFPVMSALGILVWASLRWPSERLWSYLGAVPVLTVLPFSTNTFGFDGHANRLLFALPLPLRTVLLAKNLACMALASAVFLVTLSFAFAVGTLELRHVPPAVITLVGFALLAISLGNLLSLRNPQPMPRGPGGVPRSVGLAQLGQLVALFVLNDWLRQLLVEDGYVMAASLVTPVAALGLWLASLAYVGKRLWRDRERVLRSLAVTAQA